MIAQTVCDENSLPQGAPTSPVVSNLVAHILDVRLAKLARRYGLHYTRYADDLTFSTNARCFPAEIALLDSTDKWVAGPALDKAIVRAGFAINPKKTRIQLQQSRQDVTGLIVNEKVNVRSEYQRTARAKCDHLFKSGTYSTKKTMLKDDGTVVVEDVPGTIEELDGVLSFIDSVKRHKVPLDGPRALTGQEKLYRDFLNYRHFYAPTMPLILCEGKTDNVYVRYAIHALFADYPKLAQKDGETVQMLIRLFNYSDHTKRLLGLAGGTGHFNDFIANYRKNMKRFSAKGERRPVILLIDNDSGAKRIFSCVKSATGAVCDGKAPFYFLGENLYLVLTPRTTTDGDTMIEDFLPAKWRNEKLGGKTLNLGKNLDKNKEYGKALFAEHVIKKNRKDVDFTGMKPILDRILAATEDYAKMIAITP